MIDVFVFVFFLMNVGTKDTEKKKITQILQINITSVMYPSKLKTKVSIIFVSIISFSQANKMLSA